MSRIVTLLRPALMLLCYCSALFVGAAYPNTQRPVLHGQHWVAVTGKPLSATAGARMFLQGGNAVDAACAMLAAGATIWDMLSWGGETQALVYDPAQRRVFGVNALGVAPTGATPEFFLERGYAYPPDLGPLAAVTPGTPGGLLTMLAEWGTLSLAAVLAPALELAEGYPIEAATVNRIHDQMDELRQWPDSARVKFSVNPTLQRPCASLSKPKRRHLPRVKTAKQL